MPNSSLPLPALLRLCLLLCLAAASPVRAQAPASTPSSAPSSTPSSAPAATAPSAPAAASGPARSSFTVRPVDDAWRQGLPRDARAATQAYMDRLPAAVVQKSDAYFEGGYWLRLWNFLLGLAIAAGLLHGRWASRLRDLAQRLGRRAWLRDALFGAAYGVVGSVLSLPLAVYQGYVREHAYGMATQGLGAWAGELLLSTAINTALTAVAVAVLYAIMRRAGPRWWAWGAGAAVAGLAVLVMVGPVLFDPLFNTYRPVPDGPVKTAVLAMARANGVPVDQVFVFDASRQTTRVSANVSGLGRTAAVRLNDNLLLRATLPEIRAVMAHEIGHYTLNHVPKMLGQMGLLILLGFLFADAVMRRLLARHGPRWGVRSASDVASLPLLVAAVSVFMFVATPAFNTIVRVQEVEADRFGLNLAREPHGFAEVILKLVEYRKGDPGALEEVVFFTHPAARQRIHDAMRGREAMGTP